MWSITHCVECFGTLQCVKEIGAAALAPAPSMSNCCFDLNLKNENFESVFNPEVIHWNIEVLPMPRAQPTQ